MIRNVILSRLDQFVKSTEDASPEAIDCEIAKEAFHHIKP